MSIKVDLIEEESHVLQDRLLTAEACCKLFPSTLSPPSGLLPVLSNKGQTASCSEYSSSPFFFWLNIGNNETLRSHRLKHQLLSEFLMHSWPWISWYFGAVIDFFRLFLITATEWLLLQYCTTTKPVLLFSFMQQREKIQWRFSETAASQEFYFYPHLNTSAVEHTRTT